MNPALRCVVVKALPGYRQGKGNRWVKKIISLRQTNLQASVPAAFPKKFDALQHYFNGTQPDLSWIRA
jgi:hypothetical protein